MALKQTKTQLQDRNEYLSNYISNLEELVNDLLYEVELASEHSLENSIFIQADKVRNYLDAYHKGE